MWANGTAALVYFQVEQPVAKPAARLLQASNSTKNTTTSNSTNTTTTTTPAATGTGSWEGWSGSLVQPLANNTVTLRTNKNSWGKTDLKNDK